MSFNCEFNVLSYEVVVVVLSSNLFSRVFGGELV